MKQVSLLIRLAAAALFAGLPIAGQAAPGIAPSPVVSLATPVQSGCNGVAQQLAAEYGGKARASLQKRGGQNVCVVVIVVEGKDGARAQRIERVVPAN
jgi:hypothetical protein